jgi:phosphoribosylformylglycinamidine synthase
VKPVAQVRVLIFRAAGTNCDLETEHAWQAAGAHAERVHVRRLIERPSLLNEYQAFTIPGGFSYGDDISAGRIFAAQLRRHLIDRVRAAVDAGRLVLGICNGFQILVRAGMLPFAPQNGASVACSVSYNDPPGFQDRWVTLRASASDCVFLEPGRHYEFPIAHGEGRVLFADERTRNRVLKAGLDALRYVPPPDGAERPQDVPYNPNGSEADVAGLCDATGRLLGLMPHPERFITWTQHPHWTSKPARSECDGLAFFRRAVAYFA